MVEKQYHKKTQNKLTNLFQNTISQYSVENKNLLKEINDLKGSFHLNCSLFYNYILPSKEDKNQIKSLIDKFENFWTKNELLMDETKNISLKEYKLKEYTENIPIYINEEINNIASKNNTIRNEINKKDIKIKKSKQELERVRKNALFKAARTEVYVTEPTKKSIVKNEELIDAKSILLKVSRKHNNYKKMVEKLKEELKDYKNEFNELKNKNPEILYNEDFMNSEKYKILMENDNEEEEEEEEEEKDESSEDDDNEENKSKKKKEKELKELDEKYKRLKKEYEEYENEIKKYKQSYKKMQGKIEDIKSSMIK